MSPLYFFYSLQSKERHGYFWSHLWSKCKKDINNKFLLYYFVSTDGRLYSATPVDPVFIFLPIFEEARMKVLLL